MKSNIISLLALLSTLYFVQSAEYASEAPDRFIMKFQEKLDYWILPYKLYEIYVPVSSMPIDQIFNIRQNHIGGVRKLNLIT